MQLLMQMCRRIAARRKARKISEAIDKQLKAEKEEKARGIKLLLLGSLSLFLFYVWFDFTLCWNIDIQMLMFEFISHDYAMFGDINN